MHRRGRPVIRLAVPYFAVEMMDNLGPAFPLFVKFIDKATCQARVDGVIWCLLMYGKEIPFQEISLKENGAAWKALKRLRELDLVRSRKGREGCIWFVRGPKFSTDDREGKRHKSELPVPLPARWVPEPRKPEVTGPPETGRSSPPETGRSKEVGSPDGGRSGLPESGGLASPIQEDPSSIVLQEPLQKDLQGKSSSSPEQIPGAGEGGNVVRFEFSKEGIVRSRGPTEEELERSEKVRKYFASGDGLRFVEYFPDPSTPEAKEALDLELERVYGKKGEKQDKQSPEAGPGP